MERVMKQEITNLKNPLAKHFLKLKTDSDYRYEQRSLVIEGVKAIREIPPSFIKKIIYSDPALIHGIECSDQWIAPEFIMKKLSATVNPEGLIAEVIMPPFSPLQRCKKVIALDGISDPGNMGTLLRTALALGWEGVYLLPGSCDPYNDKVLRAARGAHFKLPIFKGSADELEALAKEKKWQPLAADIEGKNPERVAPSNSRLLVLGNEARGISNGISNFCEKVTISMPGEMESLNVSVAGGILMYLLRGDNGRSL